MGKGRVGTRGKEGKEGRERREEGRFPKLGSYA